MDNTLFKAKIIKQADKHHPGLYLLSVTDECFMTFDDTIKLDVYLV